MSDEKRRTFATTIYPSISKQFKMACVANEQSMNEVIEKLMEMYCEGKIKIETK